MNHPAPILVPPLLAAAVVLLLASCSLLGTDTTTLDRGSGPTFTGPPGSLKSPEQVAGEAAAAKIAEYYETWSRLTTDPAASPDTLDAVAAGTYLDAQKREIMVRRAERLAATGDLRILSSRIDVHDIPKDQDGVPVPGTATVELTVCLDRTRYTETRDITPVPSATTTTVSRPILKNPAWPDPAGWRVTSDYTLPDTPCDTGTTY